MPNFTAVAFRIRRLSRYACTARPAGSAKADSENRAASRFRSSSRWRRRAASRFALLLGNLHAGALGKEADGVRKGKVLDVHDEVDHAAALLAAEAVIDLLVRRDGEGAGFLTVEGAQAKEVAALAGQLHIAAHHIHNVANRAVSSSIKLCGNAKDFPSSPETARKGRISKFHNLVLPHETRKIPLFFIKKLKNFWKAAFTRKKRGGMMKYPGKREGACMAVQVWMAQMTRPLTKAEYREMLALLPGLAAPGAGWLRCPRRSTGEALLCRPACCCALPCGRRYGWSTRPEIAAGAQGKPHFPDWPAVHFNLSHTAGAAAAALSDTPVGVDIERIRPVSGVRTMQRLAGTEVPVEFFQSWVRREARVKRTGSGIVTMMRQETPLNRGEFYYPLKTFPG